MVRSLIVACPPRETYFNRPRDREGRSQVRRIETGIESDGGILEAMYVPLNGRSVSLVRLMLTFLSVDESYQAAHKWITSGKAGRTHLIHSATNDLYDSTGFFVQYSQASGGIFVDCGECLSCLSTFYLSQPFLC